MRVEAIATVNEIEAEKMIGKTVVMIDVLRSSSTILAAFMAGVTQVIPVETIGRALFLKDEATLLAGERFCKKITGFHFSNSPTEIASHDVKGKSMILTTTNGTRAMQRAQNANPLLIGAFLNGTAVAQKIIQVGKDVTLYCAGSRNEFALEDGLAAGFIIQKLRSISDGTVELSDFAQLLYDAYVKNEDRLEELLFHTATGRRLSHLGLDKDISFAAQRDITAILPQMRDGRIFVPLETYLPIR